jgi:hypothetical protein
MKDRLGSYYDPIRDPILFPENIAGMKVPRWREKEKRRKQKKKDKTLKESLERKSEEINRGNRSRI